MRILTANHGEAHTTTANASLKRTLLKVMQASTELLSMFEREYEPSKHYMRGPGPKYRAKHGIRN